MKNKKMIAAVALTAVVTCIVTNTVNDVFYAQNHGVVTKKTQTVAKLIADNSLYAQDDVTLADAAAGAMVDALGDKYSQYVSKSESGEYVDYLSNRYIGLGATITKSDDGYIKVVSVNKGGPADSAGIQMGDTITAVNGESTYGADTTTVSAKMRGADLDDPEGTSVTLTILREGVSSDIEVIRGKVAADTVYAEMLDDNIGYMSITKFRVKESDDDTNPTTYELFRDKLNELSEQGMTKLIVDVRGNPGGDLDQACKTAGLFLKQDDLVCYLENADGTSADYTAEEGENVTLPMVILVDGNSASAAEAFTGALKDYEKATVVGTTTYGKGVVQRVYTLYDGSTLSITTGKYYTPNGVCIHEQGIEPDVVCDFEYDAEGNLISDSDVQLEKAIEILNETAIDDSELIMPKSTEEE